MARKRKAQEGFSGKVAVDPNAAASLNVPYLKFTSSYGACSSYSFKMLNLTNYPDRMRLGWGASMLDSRNTRSPVAVVMQPLTGERLNAQINRTVNMAEPQMGDGMLTYTERSRKRHQAENAAQLNSMILQENAKIFDTTVYMLVRSDSEQSLDKQADSLSKKVGPATGCKAAKQLSNTQAAFFAASPFALPDEAGTNAFAEAMPAQTVALAEFPQSFGFDDGSGVMIGLDKNGGTVRLDMHTHTEARPNGNIGFVSESGNGKSTAMKHISISEHVLYDTMLIVATDPESEYAKACLECGGEITDPISKLSPFEPRNIAGADSADGDDDMDAEAASYFAAAREECVLSNHIPFLKTFLSMAFPLIDAETASFLGDPITAIYANHGVTPETTFAEYYRQGLGFPDLAELYHELRREEEATAKAGRNDESRALARAAQAVKDAAVGYDAKRWNTHERFTPSTKFVVIDTSRLASLQAHEKAAQLYNILMWTWSMVRSHRFSNDGYTRIVMDELSSVVNGDNLAATSQIADMMRRVRKYNAGVLFAVQTIGSLLEDEKIKKDGKIILDNSAYKFFGSQTGNSEGNNLRLSQEYLALTDKMRDELGGAGRRMFIAAIGKHDKTWVTFDEIAPWEAEMFGKGGGR